MIIDGETYACEGCIRGHRTRSCQHKDRPLQHIKAKGRPVSQCNHCRSERKNRSAHVKCQCGKRASDGGSDCGCFSGGKCRCATKKSPTQEPTQEPTQLDAVSELSSPTASTLNTASPAQLPAGMDLQWSNAGTLASNFPSLDHLPEFHPEAWLHTPQFDMTTGFDENLSAQGSVSATPGTENSIMSQQDQLSAGLDDFANINDWPKLDDEATKQWLAAMDSPANIDLSGFDASSLDIMATDNADPSFDFDFSAIDQLAIPQQTATGPSDGAKCSSKPDKGCGPCCG